MIYTVTFNPSLDYIVSVDDFKLGLTNRTSSELMDVLVVAEIVGDVQRLLSREHRRAGVAGLVIQC